MPQTVLIVDDDPTQRRLLEAVVARSGYRVKQAASGGEALSVLSEAGTDPVDLMLLDLVMPELDGYSVLDKVKGDHPSLPVIVLTAQSGVETIVKAMRAGSADFIVKPVSPERLQVSIANALKMNALTGQISRLTRKMNGEMGFGDLITASPAMRKVLDLAQRGAASQIPVLIEGESGVGKEMVARAIQGSGLRAGKPFVAVNCGAIPDNLVESTLFGHEKGAFTGASERHIGKFQEADGGTLFLDEIGELRSDMQVKLLRALQSGEIDPVGARRSLKVDVRLISANNRDLAQLVASSKFREDLYYRLNVFPLHVPPLRERQQDIEPLLEHFVATFAAQEGKKVRGLTPEASALLHRYPWPGNVRQLENTVFRAVVLADGELLTAADFPQILQASGSVATGPMPVVPEAPQAEPPAPAVVVRAAPDNPDEVPATDAQGHLRPLEAIEADVIRLALVKYHGQMSEVARRLRIGRSTLYRKVRDLGMEAAGAE
ncbi:MAG: sigma-54-dependent Fis family transcriptional regulator [Alphaproteobacteria bacterium]|nr:sigma-54-dependent Fis family transcriptional regulator [Alphaproteobacteria bacterium]